MAFGEASVGDDGFCGGLQLNPHHFAQSTEANSSPSDFNPCEKQVIAYISREGQVTWHTYSRVSE